MVLFSRKPRLEAAICWLAGAELLALILQLSGAIPFVGLLDDVLSASAPLLVLAVFAVLFTQLRLSLASLLALLFQLVNTVMVLTGDAMQHVVFHGTDPSLDKGTLWVATYAIRDIIGNSILYAALVLVGLLLLRENRRWSGALALVNAALGYVDLAFAAQLGLPPHTNFMVIVAWLVVLGLSSWRDHAHVEERSGARGALYGSAAAA
jgi:hypothetical protein